MEIKVRALDDSEEKSSQQVEQELLDKHVEKQEPEATESVDSDTQECGGGRKKRRAGCCRRPKLLLNLNTGRMRNSSWKLKLQK